ncbi:MAG: hypothetical protein CVV28_04185 [Methanobacteriales archaeon HGW-Methanobacteriales-1]|jgi:hypothetical protein|nr:MAG: hypothetical protein CVV28_04185 [Methanobacteriales archaeon HGW-Methanobacteriales-1]
MKIKVICLLFVLLGTISAVSAHGVDVTNQSTIVIADNSTGLLAKKVVDEMGVEVKVYKFKSAADVTHQLEHALTNHNKRILAVAYQDTVNDFLAKNPTVSNRIYVSSADDMDIKNGLTLLSSDNNTGFLTPFLAGLLIGLMAGLGLGAFWMKKKLS